MCRSAAALLGAALISVTGCAPAADVRVPGYEGPPIAGRLIVVRAGPVLPTQDALEASQFSDAQVFEDATWQALQHGLGDAYRFTNVRMSAIPDSVPLAPVLVSRQVVNQGRVDNKWQRRTVYLPTAPFTDPAAEYVLLVDTVYVSRQLGNDPGAGSRMSAREIAARVAVGVAVGVLLGATVVPTTRLVRGSAMHARFALYRVGSPVPLIVDEMSGFGGGPNGDAPEGAWRRSVQTLAISLSKTGRFDAR